MSLRDIWSEAHTDLGESSQSLEAFFNAAQAGETIQSLLPEDVKEEPGITIAGFDRENLFFAIQGLKRALRQWEGLGTKSGHIMSQISGVYQRTAKELQRVERIADNLETERLKNFLLRNLSVCRLSLSRQCLGILNQGDHGFVSEIEADYRQLYSDIGLGGLVVDQHDLAHDSAVPVPVRKFLES